MIEEYARHNGHADLLRERIDGVTGDCFAGATFVNADLRGLSFDTVDFTNADLTDANLSSTGNWGVTVSGAKFDGTDLSGASWRLLPGTPASLPTNWELLDDAFLGPTANLAGLSLVGLDLTDLDLAPVNLTQTVLQSCVLNGTNLADAVLTELQSGGDTGTPSALPSNSVLLDGYLGSPAIEHGSRSPGYAERGRHRDDET
jgi:uncharacterized protein YjbI with pentapeptide repeats